MAYLRNTINLPILGENPNFMRNLTEAKIKSLKILQFLAQNYLENEQKITIFGGFLYGFLQEIIGKLVDFGGDFLNVSQVLNNSLVGFFLKKRDKNQISLEKRG